MTMKKKQENHKSQTGKTRSNLFIGVIKQKNKNEENREKKNKNK